MKLRSKILSYTLPVIIIPFLLLSAAVYYFIIRAEQVRFEEQNNQNLSEVLADFRQKVDSARRDIRLLSNVPAVKDFLNAGAENERLKSQADTVLKLFFEQNPYYLQLSLIDKNGTEIIKYSKIPSEQKMKNLTGESYFRRTLIAGSFQSPVIEIQPTKFAAVFSKSVGEEEFLGMIVLVLNTQLFENSLRRLLSRDLRTILFDDRGIIFASSFKSELEKSRLVKTVDLKNESTTILRQDSFQPLKKNVSANNNPYVFSILPSESFPGIGTFEKQVGENWFLGTFQLNRKINLPLPFQIAFFSILFFSFGAVFFAALLAARKITDPLEKVSLATNRIARGETDLELYVKTGDEVEALAEAVKFMSRELQEYQKQIVIKAKLAAMGEMTSAISHEIQNRISGISLWLQHLDSEIETDDPRRLYLDEMKTSLKGFLKLLENLKAFYKTPVPVYQKVDINSLLRETFSFAEEKFLQKKISVKTEFQSSLPEIDADKDQLQSVFLNLLLNAVDSVETGGKIKITTWADKAKNKIFIKIKDNGSGIDEKDLAKIFDPFFSTKAAGSGLGLAITSNIINAHKGLIKVESKPGEGSEFEISLPVLKK